MPLKEPRVPIEERVRRYLALMPPSISGSGGHTAFFNVVRTLLHGFGLSKDAALQFIREYNNRCDPPWSDNEIGHKLTNVDGLPCPGGRGYLLKDIGIVPHGPTRKALGLQSETERKAAVAYDPATLKQLAGEWAAVVSPLWLANRSAHDPATLTAAGFLGTLFPNGEKILIFTDQRSQGEALWPADPVPTTGEEGVWFLPQPVDGESHPNPRSPRNKDGTAKLSRRSEESVRAYRYMLLESDEAPGREWLAFLVQAPLRIEALYTSGGRSVHALVRVDCRTKTEWDEEKARMMPFLMAGVLAGADKGTWSGVRLSRLPGCWREGKWNDQDRYERYPRPKRQRLLYVRPGADGRPICELPALRDVEAQWLQLAALGISDADETNGQVLRDALQFYAPVSERCAVALRKLNNCET